MTVMVDCSLTPMFEASPPDPERELHMARRRYQRGSLRLEGERWILRWREDQLQKGTGEITRGERRLMVGLRSALPTLAVARRAADHLISKLNPLEQRSGSTITVAEFSEHYLTESKPTQKHASWLATRSLTSKHIRPFFGSKRLDEIHGRIIQQFITHLAGAGLRRKTVRNAVAVLSRMLDTARQWGYQAAPIDKKLIKFPPDEIDIEERFFTPSEAQAIIDAASGQWRVAFALLGYLGLRCSEVLGLAWPNVDFEERVIRIRQSAVMGRIQTVKSRNSKADMPMPEPLQSILAEYRRGWLPNDAHLLFANPKTGKPFWGSNFMVHHLMPLLKQLGLKHGGLHAFRHGHATNLFAAGVSAPTVRGMLRHGDLKTTLKYTHVVTQEQRSAVERTARLLNTPIAQGSLYGT